MCMSVTLISCQFIGSYNDNFGLSLNSIGADFGGTSSFGRLGSVRAGGRDPRQNRGE